MMQNRSPLSRLAVRFIAKATIGEIYEGLLGRSPSPEELTALGRVREVSEFAEIISALIASDAGFDAALLRYDARLDSALREGLSVKSSTSDAAYTDDAARLPLARYVAMIRDYIATDDHWKNQVRSRAGAIAPSILESLFGRATDEADLLEALADGLAKDGDLGRVLREIASSERLWSNQVSRNAVKIVEVVVENLTGGALQEPARNRLVRQLERSGDLSELLETLKETVAFRQASFSQYTSDVLAQLFRGVLQRAPSVNELERFSEMLRGVDDIGALVAALISTVSTTTIEPTLTFAKGTSIVGADICRQLEVSESECKLLAQSGFYGLEHNFFWGSAHSSIVVQGPVVVYLACGYLRPEETRVVSVFDGFATQTVVIDNHYACHEIRFSGDIPRRITFMGDGVFNPSATGDSTDDRNLCFQLYPQKPDDKYVFQKAAHCGPLVLFVAEDKKEVDSALPIYKRMLELDYSVLMLRPDQAIEYTRENYASISGYVVASANSFLRLHNAGCRGNYIYIEHGVSPVKQYTYSGHYRQYDLLLMPGSIWVNRLESLYPGLKGKCEVVGYSKLKPLQSLSPEERINKCARIGIDPNRPVILFAPTWSGGDERCGIFNLRYFSKDENVFTIVHDGDVALSAEFVAEGYRVIRPGNGESISDYYALADMLVSDISSTAIEFAFLGKPVICLAVKQIPDFEMKYMEGVGRLRIPLTNQYWDFCEWVNPEELAIVLNKLKNSGLEKSVLCERMNRARDFVDCCGEESVEKAVRAIDCFFERKRAAYFPKKESL